MTGSGNKLESGFWAAWVLILAKPVEDFCLILIQKSLSSAHAQSILINNYIYEDLVTQG